MPKILIEFVMDILETIVFVGSIYIVIYLYILLPNQIKGLSMIPTFTDRDSVFTSRLAYKFAKPKRGDIIVFDAPKAEGQDYTVEYIKRIIGLPGDEIAFKNCDDFFAEKVNCDTYLNGQIINEPYIKAKSKLFTNSLYKEGEIIKVPDNSLFVMGDNRPGSLDSRVIGPIPEKSVLGQVIFRYYPFNKMGSTIGL